MNTHLKIWDQMHKTLYRLRTKTMCMHKDRLLHTCPFQQIYKAVYMPYSVFYMLVIMELDARTHFHPPVSIYM